MFFAKLCWLYAPPAQQASAADDGEGGKARTAGAGAQSGEGG